MLGGDLVREARRRAGITQRELATRAGTTQSAIARLESGRTSPSLEQVQTLLRHCGFSLLVALDPYDDSDLAQAEAKLRRHIDERLDDMYAGMRFANALRLARQAHEQELADA
ncbi:MAG TPA: helix-turn-helix transcriptional regulator [Mycobacteriales bacterium]|nr:helix-turn-helix transcriptional regulator [Mycobacteriales bacterium]